MGGAAQNLRKVHCRRRTFGSDSAGQPSHTHADIDRWSLPFRTTEAKSPMDEAVMRARGGATLHYHTMDDTASICSTLRNINLLVFSHSSVELRYGSPWLAMLRTDCLNCTLERTTFQLDGGGVAVWSRLLYGRLSAYRPSFRGGMHHTSGYQSMATVD